MLDPQVAAGFLVSRTGDPDRQAARSWPASWAGCRWRWSRPPPTSRPAGTAWPGTWPCSGSGARTCSPAASPPGTPRRWPPPGRWRSTDLQHAAPGAAGLLRLLAFCAPEAVPLRLLLQPRPGLAGQLGDQVAPVLAPLLDDPLAAGDAIAALRRYSLVTPAADGSVSVHRLVQAVTADQMPAELARQWQQAAAALIEDAIPGDTGPPGTWPACAALLPHAQAALADDSDGMARIASYLGSSGSYAAARDLQRRVLDARERVLGPEHPDTLAARANLARWTGRRGSGGPGPVRRLLPAERVLARSTRHPGRWPRPSAAETGRARELLPRSDPRSTRHLTPGYLASWTGEAGDPAAARDQFAALLPVRERVLGPEHPDTLAARARPRPLDRGRRGTRPRPGTSSPRCCPCASGSSARSTRTPCAPAPTSPAGPGRRGIRPRPGTSSPRCCPCASGCLGPEHPDTLAARAQPRPLDRGGGGSGRGPGPVRRAAARARAGPRPGAPGHPERPR